MSRPESSGNIICVNEDRIDVSGVAEAERIKMPACPLYFAEYLLFLTIER